MADFNQPRGGNAMPRCGGPATMKRLPAHDCAVGLGVCFVGVLVDIGNSNRPSRRWAPRQIRDENRMLRR
jgi:guanidinobutyrase